ncbi:MAG: PadR family transcriptional regulator [Gemmatimonadota bacterium]|jgi:DNA-binding PadR family transcriptional regulator
MSKDVLGGFEHRVLLVVLQIGEGAYTAAVVEELERRTGRQAAPAAVYIAMQRLEKRGLLRSAVRTDPAAGDRRPRRYFRATPEAIEVLGEARRELTALWTGLELQGEG